MFFIELICPGSLKIDGIQQKHHRIGVDWFLNELLDESVGLSFDPGIHGINGGILIEIETPNDRVEIRLANVNKCG
ncbi:MAG: hypothetical protein BWX60_00874 [Candidatus Marinimicrobia bacterium ADurb.Bin030]|nr:MAG: hypothetical protein BWX60_00874 [Candidatus Marinimicrobia bacterium ADurb.Bin030]